MKETMKERKKGRKERQIRLKTVGKRYKRKNKEIIKCRKIKRRKKETTN